MTAQSEGHDYFALGGLLHYPHSSCLSLKMNHQRSAFWPLLCKNKLVVLTTKCMVTMVAYKLERQVVIGGYGRLIA